MSPHEIAELSRKFGELYEKGQWQEACTLAENCRDLVINNLGKQHPFYASCLNNLASIYQQMGRYDDSIRIFSELSLCSNLETSEVDYIPILNNQALLYRDLGRYDEAEELLANALKITNITPKLSSKLIIIKTNLAVIYHSKGLYENSKQLLLEVLLEYQNIGEENCSDIGAIYNNLASSYLNLGDFRNALLTQKRALTISRQIFGYNHPKTIKSLQNLSVLFLELDSLDKAELYIQNALTEIKQNLGESNLDYADCLDTLGSILESNGKLSEAEICHYQSLSIKEKLFGRNSINCMPNFNNLGVLYMQMGKYKESEEQFLTAIRISKVSLGEISQKYATGLSNLASLYKNIGKYDLAKSYEEESLKIRRSIFGDLHPDVAHSLNGLADIYRLINNYDEASNCYRTAAKIFSDVFGENHSDYVECLNGLALIQLDSMDYIQSETSLLKAIKISINISGDTSLVVGTLYNNLGNLYLSVGDFTDAELQFQRSLRISRNLLGKNHPDYALTLGNLAETNRRMGKYKLAESRCRECLIIFENLFGKNHILVKKSLAILFSTYAATSRYLDALQTLRKLARVENHLIGLIFSITSERQRLLYLDDLRASTNYFLSLAIQHFYTDTSILCEALEYIWQRKGIAAEATVAQQSILLGRYSYSQNNLREKIQKLTLLRIQIAQKTMARPTEFESFESFKSTLEYLIRQKDELEIELAQQIPEIKLERLLRAADCYKVASMLPRKSTLVEFFSYKRFNFNSIISDGDPQWNIDHYIAFILNSDDPDNVQFIDLGNVNFINSIIEKYIESITVESESRDLFTNSTSFPDIEYLNIGIDLRKVIFDPLLNVIGDNRRLFLAPDGNLTLLPFETLPLNNYESLIDKYQLSYLGTGRDVLRFRTSFKSNPSIPMVIADPNFELTGHKFAETNTKYTSFGSQSRDLMQNQKPFNRLPGTRIEGETIASILNVKALLGDEALEYHLKNCHSPRILHLATHGFFLENQPLNPDSIDFGFTDRLSGFNLENPLLRSGLALAGANTWFRRGTLPLEAEDGILNAEDVIGLDLMDTELVVLSACNTGLGKVESGEGIFGLRRAFILAGAKTLVMSLWKVPDEETQVLMIDFYNRILSGQSTVDALRNAQLALKKEYPHPRSWGAFICQGNPRFHL